MPLNHLGTIVHAQESDYSESETIDSDQEIDDETSKESETNIATDEKNDVITSIPRPEIEAQKRKEALPYQTEPGIYFNTEVYTVDEWRINQPVKVMSIDFETRNVSDVIAIAIGSELSEGTDLYKQSIIADLNIDLEYNGRIPKEELEDLGFELGNSEWFDLYVGMVRPNQKVSLAVMREIDENFDFNGFIEDDYLQFPPVDVVVTSWTDLSSGTVRKVSGPKLRVGSIKERYVDADGNEIAESKTTQGLPGVLHPITPKAIDGYVFQGVSASDQGDPVSNFESLTFSTSEQVINYNYSKISSLTAEIVPQEIVLGDEFSENNLLESVKNVSYNSALLDKNAYTIELISPPQNVRIGQTSAEIKITHVESGAELIQEIPVSVLWGHTIYSKEAGSDASTAAISLIPKSNGPDLVAVEGFGAIGTTHLSSRPHYQFFRDVYGERVANLPLGSVGQTRGDVINNWNNTLSNTNFLYGDVLSLAVNKYAVSSENYNGANTWVTRNEESILETVGFPEALYMITEQGYHLLRVNQLTTQSLTFKSNPDLIKELEERKSEFFIFHDEFEEEEIKEITFEILDHEELISLGNKQAKIRATQKIGDFTFSYDYEVSFNIESGELLINQVFDFDFGEIAKSSREVRTYAEGNEIPRIIIQDYSTFSGWSLNLSATSLSNKKGEIIHGATISLKDIKLVSTPHRWIHVSEELELSEAGRSLAVTTNPQNVNGLEQGETVIEMGDEKNGELTGIELVIPAQSSIDSDDYSSTITWELVSDPTM